ncbi:hypothetical protein D3C71_1976390 [compost metagenome]
MRGNNGFQCISDDLTAWQRIAHTDVAHGDSVVYADRIEFKRNAAGFADRFLDDFAEFLQMNMTRYNINVGVADRDERFAEILLFNSGCTQQTAVRRTVEAFFNHV